ncbi:SRPBCC family protein [Streptomyces scopuliridis]|uniref:SRPBCC family protein n=1 Tax=Streptomyces scopuliridis TaxID=452529 RepID=UPI0035DA6A5E
MHQDDGDEHEQAGHCATYHQYTSLDLPPLSIRYRPGPDHHAQLPRIPGVMEATKRNLSILTREGMPMSQTVSESIEIAASPRAVYDAVTNVAEMGRWSPECTGADVRDDDAEEIRVGTRFTGRNIAEGNRPWSTHCTVTVAAPGEHFTFAVRAIGLRIAIWSYRFEPLDHGKSTRVTETWVDQRGRIMRFIGPRVSGIHDRATHNRKTMKITLQRLKEALERSGRSA